MRTFLLFLSIFIISVSGLFSQTVIFSEDFESGTPSTDWGLYRVAEEPILAIPMGSAPAALATGGSFVGMIHDADVSYTGVAIALAGAVDARDYIIEADVYCYVGQPVSAYTGLVFYADSSHQGTQSHGIYTKLVADFDVSNRFRLYNNQLNFTTFQYTFHESIDATGLYSVDAWHHMKVEVQTLGDSLTVMTCYFDGGLLGQYIDNDVDQFDQGRFGLFAFQQDADGIAGYFDNIIVTTTVSGIDDDAGIEIPEEFSLVQNYPNPFNPTTTIEFNLDKADNVKLAIYNSSGELIKTLTNNHFSSGKHQLKWNATDQSGAKVSAGVYLYSLQTSSKSETKKMILLK
jgi:flagellar hook capping protein FlgD